jgi:glycosyltransferase involved in cell wall biosynthesis
MELERRHVSSGDWPRVMHVLGEKVRGGIEEHALSIVISLRSHGFEPHLAAPRPLLEQMSDDLRSAQILTLPIENASVLDLKSVAQFRNYLIERDIDIVHSHTFRASMFASPLARIARVPATVETYHLPEVWRQRRWLKGSFWIDRQIGRFVDQYVAVSRSAENYLVDRKGIAPQRIRLIHNGRDLTRFRPSSDRERAEARAALGVDAQQVVVMLGRLEEQKGHTFLIDAISRLASRRPSLVALFAGSGELETDLLLQRDRAALRERIKFLGAVREPEKVLAAADVVVLPSLFEGLPLAAIEALACGRPMIATNIGGSREVVIHERTGLLVPPRDPEALARAIERILSDAGFAAQLAEGGRAYVESHFDVRTQIENTIRLYKELLIRKKRRLRDGDVSVREREDLASGASIYS